MYRLRIHFLHFWQSLAPPCININCRCLVVAGRAGDQQPMIIFPALPAWCNNHHQCANAYRLTVSIFYDMILPIAKFARNVIWIPLLTVGSQIRLSHMSRSVSGGRSSARGCSCSIFRQTSCSVVAISQSPPFFAAFNGFRRQLHKLRAAITFKLVFAVS